MKPKLHVHVRFAKHFLTWELPWFRRWFELVDHPSSDALLLAFGTDVLRAGSQLPARARAALLFPGFSANPYHDLTYREAALELLRAHYDLAFVNPGPLEVAFAAYPQLVLCPFSVHTDFVTMRKPRRAIRSLLHVSIDTPQKDWRRSRAVMRLTGLRHEVYPARAGLAALTRKIKNHSLTRLQRVVPDSVAGKLALAASGYASHAAVVRKYQQYDGFVHVAAEVPHPKYIDGKYTASLLEAGLTGAILFWHDTLRLGNTLETVFDLPAEPGYAALRILDIARNLDVARHSLATREEIADKFSAERSVGLRATKMLELLDQRPVRR